MSGCHYPITGKKESNYPLKDVYLIDDFFEMYKMFKTPKSRSMLIELSKELLTIEERMILSNKVMDYLALDLKEIRKKQKPDTL